MDKTLQVLEVQNFLPDIKLPREIDPRLGEIHGVHLFIMKCKSGKSNFISNFFFNDNFYGGGEAGNRIFETIHLISPTARTDKSSQIYFQEEFEDLVVVHEDVDNIDSVVQGIIRYQQENGDIFDPDNQPERIAIVLDDVSGKLKKNSLITHLFSRYRHYNISIFLANQTIKDIPPICRAMATSVYLSACYSTLERQKYVNEWAEHYGGADFFEKILDNATEERFNYLYLKLDGVKPRAFKIGKDGIAEYAIPGQNDVEEDDENIENDSDIESENENEK